MNLTIYYQMEIPNPLSPTLTCTLILLKGISVPVFTARTLLAFIFNSLNILHRLAKHATRQRYTNHEMTYVHERRREQSER